MSERLTPHNSTDTQLLHNACELATYLAHMELGLEVRVEVGVGAS
jgi:hypothetical protein